MKKITISITILMIVVFAIKAQNNESAKLLPTLYSNNANENYSYSVAVDGAYSVIGIPGYNGEQGRAEVLQYNGSSWVSIATLTASNGAPEDMFGFSVDISGDYIVIGAHQNDSSSANSGTAYVYEKPTLGWEDMTETALLKASDAASGNNFGYSVAIDGDIIVVGALNASGGGAAYVFEKPVSGWVGMTETGKLTSTTGVNGDDLGNCVDVDGDVVVAAAYQDDNNGSNAGIAYVFAKPASGWKDTTEVALLNPSDGTGFVYYGTSLSISNDVIVVGCTDNKAYVFVKSGSDWVTTTEDAILTPSDAASYDWFGSAVSIDGDFIVVGSHLDDDDASKSGSAYVYVKPVSGWVTATEDAKLNIATPATDNYFGFSVAVSGDYIVGGAYNSSENSASEGSAYLFIKPTSGWVSSTEDYDATPLPFLCNSAENAGYTVSIDGDYAVMGAYGYNANQGCAYVLYHDGTDWQNIARLTASDGESDTYFGYSVAILGDEIIVGAYKENENLSNSGAVYVFEKPVSGWVDMTETAKLLLSDGSSGEYLGYSVDYDGAAIVAGAPGRNVDGNALEGAIYIFANPGTGWVDATESATLTISDGEASDFIGNVVSIDGDIVVAGHYRDETNGSLSGSAYIFEKTTTDWADMNETGNIFPSDVTIENYAGYDVDLKDSTIVIGAYGTDDFMGSAYVFEKVTSVWTETAILESSVRAEYDNFGIAVSIDDGLIAVGANGYNGTGSAFIFSKPESGWENATESVSLTASDALTDDYQGVSIDISGGTIIVGANGTDDNGGESGSSYLYTLPMIAADPSDISDICVGETAQFMVAAIASDFQWQVSLDKGSTFSDLADNSTYSGSTNDTLTILTEISLDSNMYRCIVTTGSNSLNSSSALLAFENEDPVLSVKDTRIYLDENGEGAITLLDIMVNATDNCSLSDTTLGQSAFSCDDLGTVAVDVTLTDVAGNVDIQQSTITVADTISPAIICPSDTVIKISASQTTYTVSATELDLIGSSDNCSIETITNDLNSTTSLAGETLAIGTQTITWTINDASSNSNHCSFDVSVQQSEDIIDGIETASHSISVFPVPASNFIIINCNGLLNENLSIMDVSGAVVLNTKVENSSMKLDISNFNKGVYFIKSGSTISKFVKE